MAKGIKTVQDDEEKIVNCLKNEKVKVEYIKRTTGLVKDFNHILGGGLADSASISYTVPLTASGTYARVLDENERKCLEEVLQLDDNSLSVYRTQNNFWENFSVTIPKNGKLLSLSDPNDYIAYKVLLANHDFVAPSKQELEQAPKATYRFVLVSENDSIDDESKALTNTMKAYEILGGLKDDFDKLKFIVQELNKKTLSNRVKLDFLQGEIYRIIRRDPQAFIKVADDKYLSTKVLIMNSVIKGTINKKGDYYYLASNNLPLCRNGANPVLQQAAEFIALPENQEIKFSLEEKEKD